MKSRSQSRGRPTRIRTLSLPRDFQLRSFVAGDVRVAPAQSRFIVVNRVHRWFRLTVRGVYGTISSFVRWLLFRFRVAWERRYPYEPPWVVGFARRVFHFVCFLALVWLAWRLRWVRKRHVGTFVMGVRGEVRGFFAYQADSFNSALEFIPEVVLEGMVRLMSVASEALRLWGSLEFFWRGLCLFLLAFFLLVAGL